MTDRQQPAFEVKRSFNAPLGEPRPTIVEDRPMTWRLRPVLAMIFMLVGAIGMLAFGFALSTTVGCIIFSAFVLGVGVILALEEV